MSLDVREFYGDRPSAPPPVVAASKLPRAVPLTRVADPAVIAAETAEMLNAKRRKVSNDNLSAFLKAGNFTFTLRNTRSGNRFTFKVSRNEDDSSDIEFWVAVLTGPNNEDDYTPLGRILKSGAYLRNKSSRIGEDAPSAKAFDWLFRMVSNGKDIPDFIEVWHSSHCCRCGRKLTVEESIERGYGPECYGKIFR